MSVRLKFSDVGRDYGRVSAVRGFNLEVEEGEFISLLGPSGCGKTTMLRMLAGFIAPTAGTIAMNGRVISSPGASLPPEKRGMSMIFQSYAIWPNMTVAQNVAFGLELRRIPAAECRRRVQDILDIVQLGAHAARYPAELSGGQQQRVALARAVVVQPEVLLLDEPLSNLDANLREEMRGQIRRIHDEFRITTIYVTHDQAEAMSTSNRIVVMNQGRIEQVAAPTSLYEAPRTRFVASFIGKTNLLSARAGGGMLDFTAFAVPAARLAAPPADGPVTVSLRPQHVVLATRAPADSGGLVLQGRVTDAAYMGGHWEYALDIGNGISLSAISAEITAFRPADTVWIAIDPARMVAVAET